MRIIALAFCSVAVLLALSMAATASVIINEMELNPPEGGADWLELYNSGNESVDVSGWTATITDNGWIGKMAVPAGTIIPAGGYYLLIGQSTWTHQDGGFATLYTASGDEVDETALRQDTLDNDFTWGRHPDGHDTNTDGDWGFGYATRGRSNVR